MSKYGFGALAVWFGLCVAFGVGRAQTVAPPIDIPCPTDEPCQVLVLTKTEVAILTQDNGILATASQARNLDLGQFVSYFRQKIALAPAGKNAPKPDEKKPAEAPKQPEAAKK